MKSKIQKAQTKLPIRCSLEFSNLCRFHSAKAYPEGLSIACGSAAHFLRQAAKEKLIKLGVPIKFLDSIV
jgi:hypothetical protein